MRGLIHGVLALTLLAGCPKPSVPQAPTPTNVRFASVLESVTDGAIDADSTAVDAVSQELSRRNLTPMPVDVDAPHRKRFETLASGSQGGLVLLVESTARYSSQMNGRYRWTVDVEARLADVGSLDDAAVSEFTVPVHLLFAHERENDALIAATPSIARRVGGLLDEWIASQK